jgi:ubiquinone biosynthesis protein
MMDWNSLLDEAALASVLPGTYARFTRPIREGLIVFLEGLPPAVQEEILAQQAALPWSARISERLSLLARSCPVLHKLGQVLARDQCLAPELRQYLRGLESLAPSVSETIIQKTLTDELGPLERRGIRLVAPAIAEASVAVVIPFVYTPSNSGDQQNGVFKVLKPGIEDRLELELELLGFVGVHLDERCVALAIPHLEYEELFEQIRDKLRHEVHLDQEQQHLVQAGRCFADDPQVHIPALIDHCTPRVTAMERITGGKVTDHRREDQLESRLRAELVVGSLISRPIFSHASQAMFHGDPHAGNLFWTDENRLAILDWSLVGSLGERDRVAIVQIMLGAIMLDAGRIAAILESLSAPERVPHPPLIAIVDAWLKRIRRGSFPGLSWLVGMLDEAVQTAGLRVGADLMLFRKSLHTLEGIIADIGAGKSQIDDILMSDFWRQFTSEWPRRWVSPPLSRQFATRLSNFDLTQTLLSTPAIAARFWMGQTVDLLDACWPISKL